MPADDGESQGQRQHIFDLTGIDLSATVVTREQIAQRNPHRGVMALLDSIVYMKDGGAEAIGLKKVRGDEFWCAGHFPDKPIYPGVLQVESGAQLAAYLYYLRTTNTGISVFLRIEDACFRSMVVPGDDLYILCKDHKFGRRRFICDVQGVVNGRVTFDARLSGMTMNV